MSPPLDASVENLQTFCDLLEATNPPVEAGVADLARLAQALGATEGRLANGLHSLDTELDGVQKEAETSEASAVKACAELNAAAKEELETELPDVERQAAAAEEEWSKELDAKARAVDTAFQELESDGWAPLDTGLESERRDFEQWSKEADAAIGRIDQAVVSLTTQVERDGSACANAIGDATGEPFFDHSFWEPAHLQAEKVDTTVVQSFRTERDGILKEMSDAYADLVSVMEGAAQKAREAVAEKAEEAASGIRDQTEQATLAVDAAEVALEAAKVEFDRSALAAEAAEPKAAGLVQLETGIEAADARLAEMRAAMEAMSQ
jgi:hypothetical protein